MDNKKQRLEKLKSGIFDLIESHMREWEEADVTDFDDIDKIMEQIEATANQPSEPVTYQRCTKKSAY